MPFSIHPRRKITQTHSTFRTTMPVKGKRFNGFLPENFDSPIFAGTPSSFYGKMLYARTRSPFREVIDDSILLYNSLPSEDTPNYIYHRRNLPVEIAMFNLLTKEDKTFTEQSDLYTKIILSNSQIVI